MEVLRTAILEMCRQKKNTDFCPSEVVKKMFPEDWDQFMEEIISIAIEMDRKGLILITQNGKPIDSDSVLNDSIRICNRNPNQSRSGAVLKLKKLK